MIKHAFEDAYTQKNKAVRTRYRTEMTKDQQKLTSDMFRSFIRHACENDNQTWYEKNRRRILAGADAAD